MSDDDLELVRGRGNVFRDFGDANPDLEQARAILAANMRGAARTLVPRRSRAPISAAT